VRVPFPASIRALLPQWVGRWKQYAQRLRTHLRRLRFGRYDRIPEVTVRPRSPTLAGQEARAPRLALIVPFRDSQHAATLSQGEGRAAQLTKFLEYMTGFLAGRDYHIFVIEQSQDSLPFNKGCLMNVGFNLAAPDFDYFAFHDIDQLPTDPRNSYSYPQSPLHLCVVTDGRTQYRSTVGGVLLINKDDFVACNGWSNRYLGWGQEDDDMANRLRHTVGFRRVAEDVGTYTSLRHPRVPGLDETYQFQKNRAYLEQSAKAANPQDGYRDATFEIVSRTELSARCTRWVVAIPGPSHRFGYHCYVKSATAPGDVSLLEHTTVRAPIVALQGGAIDRKRVRVRAGGGGIPLQPVPEEQEFATFEPGALHRRDPGALDLSRLGGYQQRLLASAAVDRGLRPGGEEPMTTFVVERREYVNLYHTLIELFNAYVAIQLLGRGERFHLLLLDGHCRGELDPLWTDILRPARVLRLQDYPRDVIRFKKLVLVPGGYDSPLYNTGRLEPSRFDDFLSDFIGTVLAAYEVADRPRPDRVLTFVDRRDYKPHPSSDGIVCRKVDNLDSTVSLLKRLYPQHQVQVRTFEDLPFGEQLQVVRDSDVLCGVHGAALTHVLFMRPGTALVEFRPHPFRKNAIFENLAGFKRISYRRYHARTQRVLANGKLVVSLTDTSV